MNKVQVTITFKTDEEVVFPLVWKSLPMFLSVLMNYSQVDAINVFNGNHVIT